MTKSEQQLRQDEGKNKMQWKQFAFFKIQIYMQFSFFFVMHESSAILLE